MEKTLFWLINLLRDLLFQRGKNKKDVQYLATQIVLVLDRYVVGCAAVVSDDGLYHGQPDEEGCRSVQVSDPTFDLSAPAPEWKLLPTKLMHELVHFPNDIGIANSIIDAASDHACPPDYEEAFEERQYQYAKLGIKASRLASDLRALTKLPPGEVGEWDVVKYLEGQEAAIMAHRESRAAEHAKFLTDLTKAGGNA